MFKQIGLQTFHLPAFAILVLLSAGCGRDAEPNSSGPTIGNVDAPARRTPLISNINHLRVRETPGPDGKIIATLSEGDTLFDLGEVSAFTTEVSLRGIRFNEPWIKVRTQDSLSGWVFGGGVNFQMKDEVELTRRLMKMRLQTFFGDSLAQDILDYRGGFQRASSSSSLAAMYREGRKLRDTLVQVFDKRITLLQGPDQIPNLGWMKEAIPGLTPQRVAEGTAFYLFFDYTQWLEKSRKTSGAEDNQFFDACLTAYGLDSVEYFLPDWCIAVSEETVYSELGKGVHRNMLEKMTKALAASALFEPEYMEFKTRLLDDISGLTLSYWNDQAAILAELDAIILADFGILTSTEKASLKARRKQFEQPAANGIKLNFRNGLEQ
jgi:hypothetical protein